MYVQWACTCTCTSGMYGVHVYVLRDSTFEFSNGMVWESGLRLLILTFKHAYTCTYSVIMVVGAGRGPVVDASLRAAYSINRRVMIYAVEKNPGAVIT